MSAKLFVEDGGKISLPEEVRYHYGLAPRGGRAQAGRRGCHYRASQEEQL